MLIYVNSIHIYSIQFKYQYNTNINNNENNELFFH